MWHNLVLAFVAWLLWEQGAGLASRTMLATAWGDISGSGALVTEVQRVCPRVQRRRGLADHFRPQTSPLHGLLKSGDSITRLDDFPLDTTDYERPPEDPWSRYLLLRSGAGDPRYDNLGWCVDARTIASLPSDCCSNPTASDTLCFVSDSSEAVPASGCASVESASAIMQTNARCVDGPSCAGDSTICVRPHMGAHLIRLAVKSDGEAKVLLFQGNRRSLHEQGELNRLFRSQGTDPDRSVRVTWLRPSFLLPLSLGTHVEDTLSFVHPWPFSGRRLIFLVAG